LAPFFAPETPVSFVAAATLTPDDPFALADPLGLLPFLGGSSTGFGVGLAAAGPLKFRSASLLRMMMTLVSSSSLSPVAPRIRLTPNPAKIPPHSPNLPGKSLREDVFI